MHGNIYRTRHTNYHTDALTDTHHSKTDMSGSVQGCDDESNMIIIQ
jgi:hypothetical protein